MPKEINRPKEASKIILKIVKNLGRNDLDWTYQESVSSVHPTKITYAVMIESPANGLQPLTWVCDSYNELIDKLKLSEKHLDEEAVMKAWHEAEIARGEKLIAYHKEKLEEGLKAES